MPVIPPMTSQSLMPANMQTMAGTIPLSMLMDFIVQRTYHDLTVLSEL